MAGEILRGNIADREPQIGEMLGQFRLEQRLGAGGMGVVFKALDTQTNHFVALKVLWPKLARDLVFATRFIVESRAAIQQLGHPNIAAIYSVEQLGEMLFFAMEYLEGESLEKMVESGHKFSDRDILGWIRAAAIALQYAQGNGIIHRDIKPSNFIITSGVLLKITDFGMTKALNAERLQSMDPVLRAEILGNPHYLSPEQASGEKLDHRSDIYALGATLFYLLARRPPFMGADPMAVLVQHQRVPLPDVRKFNKDVSPDYNALLYKMMSKSVHTRHQTYRELISDLDDLLAKPKLTPVAGQAPEIAVQAKKVAKARVPNWVFAVAVLVTMIVGYFMFRPTAKSLQREQEAKRIAQLAAAKAAAEQQKPVESPFVPPPTEATPVVDIEKEAQNRFEELKIESDAELASDRFGAALGVYAFWFREYEGTKGDSAVKTERERIKKLADTRWKDISNQAESLRTQGKYAEALDLYDRVVEVFGITDYKVKAQERSAVIVKEFSQKQKAQQEQEVKYFQVAGQAKKQLSLAQYDAAQKTLADAMPSIGATHKEKLDALRAEASRIAGLKSAIFQRMAKQPNPLTLTTRVGKVSGLVSRVDAEIIVLRENLGQFGFSEKQVKWSDLSQAAMLQLYQSQLDPRSVDEFLSYALLLYYLGQPDRAKDFLEQSVQKDTSKKAALEAYLGRVSALEREGKEAVAIAVREQHELDATKLWQKSQADVAAKNWPDAQRNYQMLINQFKDTMFVRIDTRNELAQLAKTLEKEIGLNAFVVFDLAPVCNASVYSTAQALATDMFDPLGQLSWATSSFVQKIGGKESGVPEDGRLEIPRSEPRGYFQLPLAHPTNAILLTSAKGRRPKSVEINLPANQIIRYSHLAVLHSSTLGEGVIRATLQYNRGANEELKLQTFNWTKDPRALKSKGGAFAVKTRTASHGGFKMDGPVRMVAQIVPVDSARAVKKLTLTLESYVGDSSRPPAETEANFTAGIFAISALPAR